MHLNAVANAEVNDFSVFSGRWPLRLKSGRAACCGSGCDRRRSNKNATGNGGHYARDRYEAGAASVTTASKDVIADVVRDITMRDLAVTNVTHSQSLVMGYSLM